MRTWLDGLSLRLAGAALVVALATLVAPSPAQAQSNDFNYHLSDDDYALIAAGGLATIAGAGFLVTDFVYAAQGSWVPPLAAGLELVLAGLPWLVLCPVVAIDLGDRGAAAAVFLVGAGFSAHAMASFVLYDPAPHPPSERALRESGSLGSGLHVVPWLGPRQAGAGMFARF